MSKSTVKKHVDGLRNKGLIETQYTTVTTRDGRTHNGSLCYTILPIEPIEEAYFEKMLRLQNAKNNIKTQLEKHEKQERRLLQAKSMQGNENFMRIHATLLGCIRTQNRHRQTDFFQCPMLSFASV